jgi:steroid delta-isomerase-like uncharacterized protein
MIGANGIDVVLRLVQDVWNGESPSTVVELISPDLDNGPNAPRGPQGVREWHARARSAFPDTSYTIEDIFTAEGGRVVIRWSARGHHMGQMGPLAATGRLVEWTGIHVFRVEDGLIVDVVSEADLLGRLQQLGVRFSPPPAAG